MRTLVFPNTDHPSRGPVTPDKPLPASWKNCYHASCETVELRVPATEAKRNLATSMSVNRVYMQDIALLEDEKRRDELSKVYHQAHLPLVADYPGPRARSFYLTLPR